MSDPGHGRVGQGPEPFTNLLPLRPSPYPVDKLLALSEAMKGDVDTVKDGPDPEENLWVPAGYTYFGQFIDHDLTFDSTSTLNLAETNAGTRVPTNLRTPRLDLDCVYGDGPAAQPFMYADDGATLLYGGTGQPIRYENPNGLVSSESAIWDLLRAPNGRAIIGDKRNDENSIVCQIQLAFIKYHNAIVEQLKGEPKETWNSKGDLFTSARNEVRWAYQQLVLEDFLPRIIQADVMADLRGKTKDARAGAYALYTPDLRTNLPREFVVAAYRFGHSGVRTGYRLNRHTRLSIFPSSEQTDQGSDSLLGFDPLPKHHVIDDWGRFFPKSGPGHDIGQTGRKAADDTPHPAVRLQFAYKLDPTLVDPLGVLPPGVAGGGATAEAKGEIAPATLPNPDRPSLALLNLLRANSYAVAGGQAVAAALAAAGKPVTALSADQLVVRTPTDQAPSTGNPKKEPAFQWVEIDEALQEDTPLWFYLLAEAQAPMLATVTGDANRIFLESDLLNGAGALTQLGWVGGRIVAEVFYGLVDEDADSFVNVAPPGWTPRLAHGGSLHVRNLLDFKG